MRLQLAIDCQNQKEMLEMMEPAAEFVDIIESGTPLLLGEGLNAVREMKRRHPKKIILADAKIMDAGEYEAQMACDAGADIVTVMGAAGDATIREAVKATHAAGRLLAVDTLGMPDPVERCVQVDALGVDIVYLHTSFDEFDWMPPPAERLAELKGKSIRARIAVTGGITLENVDALIALNPDIIVIGRSITRSDDIRAAARAFHDRIKG